MVQAAVVELVELELMHLELREIVEQVEMDQI